MRVRVMSGIFALLLLVGAHAQPGLAQQYGGAGADPTQVDALLRRLEQQDARIRELEARSQTAPYAMPVSTVHGDILQRLDALEASASSAPTCADGDGWKDVSSEGWTVKWGGRVMFDYVMFADQDAANLAEFGDLDNYFEVRRLRFEAAGTGYGVYDFKVQLDFEPENNFTVRNSAGTGSVTIGAEAVAIKDVYVGIHEIPMLGYVRFGNFYEPIGLESQTSSKYITFMERSLPVIFARDRRIGAAFFNNNEDNSLGWAFGVYFPDVNELTKEQITDNPGTDIAGRVWGSPYYAADGRYVLHWGAAYVYQNTGDDTLRFRTRPETHEESEFLDTGSFASDENHRMGLEGAVVYGPLSFQSEFYYLHAEGLGAQGPVDFHGAYAYVSYFITGEHRPYERKEGIFGRVKPLSNFFIVDTCGGRCAGWGAWEVAARWSYVDLNDADLAADGAGELHDFTLGVNWYWTSHTKWMFNYIHAFNERNDVGRNDADILAVSLRYEW
jgi:phosphate-selective porin OprO/OprP